MGVIVGKADRENRRKRMRGYIAMLAVDKPHRKRGIGRELVMRIVQRMKEQGCDEVVLETELSNGAALSLYEGLGFTRDKRLSRYYLNGSDAFRLKLWFTSPTWADPVPPAPPVEAEAPPVAADAVTEEPAPPPPPTTTTTDQAAPATTTTTTTTKSKSKKKR